MEIYSIIVIAFGIIGFFILGLLYYVNRVIQYKNRINKKYLAIELAILERVDILDEMLDILELDSLKHENSLRKLLLDSRNLLMGIKSNNDGISAIKKTNKTTEQIVMLKSTYKELAKNEDYLEVLYRLKTNRNNFRYAIDGYNREVDSFTNYKEDKFIRFVSRLCRIPEYVGYMGYDVF